MPLKGVQFWISNLFEKRCTEDMTMVKEFRELGVKRVAPTHCTGEEATRLFKEEYKEDFLSVGKIIEV